MDFSEMESELIRMDQELQRTQRAKVEAATVREVDKIHHWYVAYVERGLDGATFNSRVNLQERYVN